MLFDKTSQSIKFLVTGGAGFIGSHLCDRLIAMNHQVIILDNLSTGHHIHPKAEFFQGDVTDSNLVFELLNRADGCFHLAAIPSVALSHQDWLNSTRINLLGSVTVLDAAKRLLPSRKIPIIYTSSAAVYGDQTHLPLTESSPLFPLSAYAVDKLATEQHAAIATLIHGIPTVGLRLFNVFGPRQDPSSPYSGVISTFVEKLKTKKTISIFGDGEQLRDFIFIDDVITAMIAAFSIKGLAPKIYNVCTGKPFSINQLAKEIASLVKAPLKIQYLPTRKGDIRISIGDPNKAMNDLGFNAQFKLADGLIKMLAMESSNAIQTVY